MSNIYQLSNKETNVYNVERKDVGFVDWSFHNRVGISPNPWLISRSNPSSCSIHFTRTNTILAVIGTAVLCYCFYETDAFEIARDFLLNLYFDSYFYYHDDDDDQNQTISPLDVEDLYSFTELEQIVIDQSLENQYCLVDNASGDDKYEYLKCTGSINPPKSPAVDESENKDFKSLSMFRHDSVSYKIKAADLTVPHSIAKIYLENREKYCKVWELLPEDDND